MNSLKLISNHITKLGPLGLSLLNPNNFTVVIRNFLGILRRQQWNNYIITQNKNYNDLARLSLRWLKYSQDLVGSGGVGCYEFYRWTKGYPEVTGYIIPTFWDAYHLLGEKDFRERAIKMANWELEIQKIDGGWEGFYEGDGQSSVVFNSGQVLRGLIRTYQETGEQKYLSAAVRGADWIVNTQDADGSWTSTNFKQMKRVYDSYVAAPLAELYKITLNEKYRESSIKNCEFVLGHQHENGWFDLCDNTLLNNEAPVTHTLAYTIDGLIEVGQHLEDDRFIQAGKKAADALLHKAEILPLLFARFDKKWKSRANYVCNTGNAQLGIIFMKLFEMTGELRYMNTALKMADFLAYVQNLNSVGKFRNGGITGSYPVWGMYCPFKYPSWATKYYTDLLFSLNKHVR
jgi:rhamnogalacturonyl hydrolase YesR